MDRYNWINMATQFLSPSFNYTVTIPSTSITPITVGAYNHLDNSLYISSGRGPTRDGRIKPEMIAPGVNILGPIPNNQYTRRTGTSIAAAHLAGGTALILEWGIELGNDINMNTQTVKNVLIRGANRIATLDYPNNDWGFGTLNLINSFEILRGSEFEI